MSQILTVIAQVGMLLFVVAGMAAMGLNLTLKQVAAPLRDVRLVAGALVVNFLFVPALGIGLARLLPMDEATGTAVVLVACCAGAPFLPALAKLAKADQALAVGLMVLLTLVTVGFAPIVVPLAVPGATVTAWDVASSLVVLMLIPLALDLLVRASYPEFAASAVDRVGEASIVGMGIGVISALLVSWRHLLGSVGSWIFVGIALLLAAAWAAGWFAAAGRGPRDRSVLALASAQRNISAALVVASSLGPDVITSTLVASLVIPIVLLGVAGELGRGRGGKPSGLDGEAGGSETT